MNDRLVKVLKVLTCLSCGLPSESVSESYWTALQRESHGHIWGRPSEMQKVGRRGKREWRTWSVLKDKREGAEEEINE